MNKLQRLDQDRLNIESQQDIESQRAQDIKADLYVITYEYLDGGTFNIFAVGVDMDDSTAELLVEKEVGQEHFDTVVGQIKWEQVPDVVDNFNIIVEEVEA